MIQKMGLGLLLCGAVIGARAEGFPPPSSFGLSRINSRSGRLEFGSCGGRWFLGGRHAQERRLVFRDQGRFVVISQQGVKLYGDKDYDTEYLFVGDGVGPVVNAYLSNRAWVSFSVDKEGVAYRVPYVAADYTCALALPKGDTWCTNGRQQVVPKAPAFLVSAMRRKIWRSLLPDLVAGAQVVGCRPVHFLHLEPGRWLAAAGSASAVWHRRRPAGFL